MNKICTSIEQSKQLIELGIDVSTADMCYRIVAYNPNDTHAYVYQQYCFVGTLESDIPAWSLAALLNVIKDKCGYFELVYLKQTSDGRANTLEDVYRLSTDVYDVYNTEAVDACVEMIVKLKELKML